MLDLNTILMGALITTARGDPMAKTELLTLGGGCFWCLEAVYEDVPGVIDVTSGYAGGTTEHPAYRQVISGHTGHAEVVQITYDPSQVDLDKLLEIFWVIHDPTTADRQGNDVGDQYRSIVLVRDEAQEQAVRASIAREQAAGTHQGDFTTQVVPLARFCRAYDLKM